MTLWKGDNPERGSIILVLPIVIIVMTTAAVLIQGTLSEFFADRNRQNDIVARYAAEAGAEQYLYEVVSELNRQNKSTLRSHTTITPPQMTGSTRWTKEDASGHEKDISSYTYLDVSRIDDNTDFPWTTTSSGNRLPDGGYFLLKSPIEITNNSSEEESASVSKDPQKDPEMYLPTIANMSSEPIDSFQLKYTITAVTAAGVSRDLEVTSVFNVKLKQLRYMNNGLDWTMEWGFEMLK
ncbi:hypothetical protein GTO89_09685 [Heliobacterium gestii]|uniref:Uncharacterized protein n=1 Tax=Heliomicrobium gestii TaxID=2699 RepID=A0A845LFC1_HELGE|nr:hypothetical protein [Heliomicrobium gestii]MBM7867879.1 hypothetical protein [Heliomicrobium gestii]MZP43309.1 hypothetical protein [Heliomicrobium gestii]